MYSITVSYADITKQQVFDQLAPLCSSLIVAEESHYNGSFHHHIFMQTYMPVDIKYLRHQIYTVYQIQSDVSSHGRVLVEKCKSQKSWIKYITKEDSQPLLKGVDIRALSFYCLAIDWARNTPQFKFSDPFVLNHPQYFRLLEYVHRCVRSRMNAIDSPAVSPYFYVMNANNDHWQFSVLRWWNDWIMNGWVHKKQQLYLYGPSNTGKTTFVHKLLSKCMASNQMNDSDEYMYEQQIYQPLPNEPRYAFQDYDADYHKIVKIDEFDIREYKVCELKKLLAGESLRINCKNQSGRVITHRNPVILISNLEPPNDRESIHYKGFRERLFVVYADRLITDFI